MQIQRQALNDSASLTAYVAEPEVGYRLYRKRPGIVLAPGGAYLMHATREKEGVALEFLAKGYNVFLLEYSLGFSSREVRETMPPQLDTDHRFPLPLLEMLQSIHIIKQRADEWNTDASRLFLMGFSAGGHLCGAAGVFWNDPQYIRQLPFAPVGDELKAAGMILCYPLMNACPKEALAINAPDNSEAALIRDFLYGTRTPNQSQIDALDLTKHVTKDTVPTFLWHSIDDPVVLPKDSTRFILAMQEAGVECEYHLYDRGGHGIGLANRIYAHNDGEIMPDLAAWTAMADAWMQRQPRKP